MTSPLVRWTFAVLVLATIAAFFVTQQLKGEVPTVLRFATSPPAFSPNGDHFADTTRVGFDLSRPARVTFDVISDDGTRVRRLVNDRRLAGDRKYRYVWDGRDDAGRRVPDGSYRLRVIRKDQGRILDSIKRVRVDTVPPRVQLVSARPSVIAPSAGGRRPRVVLRYRGPRNRAPEVRVFRTDEGPPRVVARFRGDDRRRAVWDGYVRGRPAVDGDYAFTFRVRDAAGNVATGPRAVPTAAAAPAGTGVVVRHLALTGPVGVVRAGATARLRVLRPPGGPPPRLALLPPGGSRPVASAGAGARLRVPAGARTGLYVVRVRVGRRSGVWPLAVQGRRARGPLVVLPVASWQGAARTDDDLDGFADTLADAHAVPLPRPYPHGGAPPGFAQTAALLRFLDRERLRYDLTTDVALARHPGSLAGARGVALAGSERWLPRGLDRALRAYVGRGGRLASFGADALRRLVTIGPVALRDPTRRATTDLFGERTTLLDTPRAPLVVGPDALGLFGGGGLVGEFSRLEVSLGLGHGARVSSAAGREPGRPAFVAYRVGRGLVVRVGTPQWTRSLAPGGAVGEATVRLWRLLSRSR